jgi:hypothetical protein
MTHETQTRKDDEMTTLQAAQNDGGPAFPSGDSDWEGGPFEPGMTLRDYFAAAALTGYCSQEQYATTDSAKIAAWAYQDADSMLAERGKPRPT